MGRITAIYRHACPNCGGPIDDLRLEMGIPCEKCLPIIKDYSREELYKELLKRGTLSKDFQILHKQWRLSKRFEQFFMRAVGSKPWGAQRTWARRLSRKDSFSIIAPTGVGKTTFGLVYSAFLACKHHGKSYIILPTTPLVIQAVKKLETIMEKTGCRFKVAFYHSKLKKKEKEEMLESIAKGDYDILITTVAFARSKTDLLDGTKFRLIFVDDVDAVLKSGRSISSVLKIAGFPPSIQEKGLELYYLRRRIAYLYSKNADINEILELESKAEKIEKEIEPYKKKASSLIVSSATGRPRGVRAKLFRILLGFDVGGRGDIGIRKIIDSYHIPEKLDEQVIVDIIGKLGPGGLVYVPIDKGIEYAEKIVELLRKKGIKAEAFHSKRPIDVLEAFEKGETDVLVGVANYYGVLVRGIDMPWRVRYAVFAGVPRMKFAAKIEEPHPLRISRLLGIVAEVLEGELREEAIKYLAHLRKVIRRLSPAALQVITEKLIEGDEGLPGSIQRVIIRALAFLRQALETEEVWIKLRERGDVGIVEENGELYLLVPDPYTYLQASGRTSRLYAGGITLGLSVVIVDDIRVFRGLESRVRYMVETNWYKFEDLDLDKILNEIDEERRKIKEIKRTGSTSDLVKTALLIVESPNKARTIANFFGKPSIRELPNGLRAYEVSTGDYILTIAASGGHVYDLVVDQINTDELPSGLNALDYIHGVIRTDNGFVPIYTTIKKCLRSNKQTTAEITSCPPINGKPDIMKSTLSVLGDLRRIAWEVDIVLLGTDPDTEGEKISKDLYLLLKPYSQRIHRLEFHEVTKKAILAALNTLREIDNNLVDAQTVRRVEDRWIGFTLSPILWYDFWPNYCKKITDKTHETNDSKLCKKYRIYTNLSAGRVQTPTLGWIVKRTKQHLESQTMRYTLILGDGQLRIRLFADEISDDVRTILDSLNQNDELAIELIHEEVKEINPPPPFTTDEMIVEASRRLRLSAPQVMRLAQNLFELGLITYHRTDSHRVSDKGKQVAREYLREKYGEEYTEIYAPRSWGEGGAHEAIRPTRPIDVDTLRNLIEEGYIELASELTRNHYRLYDMIFRRFIASQMKPGKVSYRVYTIKYKDTPLWEGELPYKILYPGFLEIYPEIRPVKNLEHGKIVVKEIVKEKINKVPLYTDGDVVKLMKERRIGRPSTYAKIIDTIVRRKYVFVVPKTGQLISTKRGENVYYYLIENFGALVSEERTRLVEDKMRMIESGEANRDEVLYEVYDEIRPIMEKVKKNRWTMEKAQEVIEQALGNI